MENQKEAVEFKAARGSKAAMRKLADIYKAEGKDGLAAWWRVKADGHNSTLKKKYQ